MIQRLRTAWLLAALLILPAWGRADVPATRPATHPAVKLVQEMRTEPDLRIYAVRIDLSDPDVQIAVARGGPDPDGPGPWQTTLDETSDIARRENFDIAINGDFFSVETVIDPETGKKKGYHEGQSALVIGPAMTDGRQWARSEKPRPVLMILRDRRAVVDQPKQLPPAARQVMAGSHIVLKGGRVPELPETAFATLRHPRTAVGTADAGRTLVLVVVDGRRPGVSVGMTLAELAELMRELGCEDALNLDGGGSSTLVVRQGETDELKIINQPSDGKERPVANVLGIRLGSAAARSPATAPRTGENRSNGSVR